MTELSIFIDESGDFGPYDFRSPYYIVSMVFHEQCNSIAEANRLLEFELSQLNLSEHCIHTGPIVRGENEYRFWDINTRRKIFHKMFFYLRNLPITYYSFYIEKKHMSDSIEAIGKLSQAIANFIKNHYDLFLSYDTVKIYYDNGQIELNRILSSIFHSLLPNVEFRKVAPADYRLFQVADLLCYMQLVQLKYESHTVSKTELAFLGSTYRIFKQNYWKHLQQKLLK